MSTIALVIGKSGTGKSRSIVNLDPQETVLINVNRKDLPFRGWKSKYTPIVSNPPSGNMLASDNHDTIIKTIKHVDTSRPEIKVGIIDDFQYIMANEYMRRSKEPGFQKFADIGEHAWKIIWESSLCRPDLMWVFLSHSDENDHGEQKCKTIGKMLDEKICIEGMFTVVLNTLVERSNDATSYWFETQNNGRSTSKSPEGMFTSHKIPNDLKTVITAIKSYEQGE